MLSGRKALAAFPLGVARQPAVFIPEGAHSCIPEGANQWASLDSHVSVTVLGHRQPWPAGSAAAQSGHRAERCRRCLRAPRERGRSGRPAGGRPGRAGLFQSASARACESHTLLHCYFSDSVHKRLGEWCWAVLPNAMQSCDFVDNVDGSISRLSAGGAAGAQRDASSSSSGGGCGGTSA